MEEKKVLLEQLEKNFIEEFKSLRKYHKLTQERLSKKSFVVRESIARIESSKVSPQLSTIIKMLEPIGYTIAIKKITEE